MSYDVINLGVVLVLLHEARIIVIIFILIRLCLVLLDCCLLLLPQCLKLLIELLKCFALYVNLRDVGDLAKVGW